MTDNLLVTLLWLAVALFALFLLGAVCSFVYFFVWWIPALRKLEQENDDRMERLQRTLGRGGK